MYIAIHTMLAYVSPQHSVLFKLGYTSESPWERVYTPVPSLHPRSVRSEALEWVPDVTAFGVSQLIPVCGHSSDHCCQCPRESYSHSQDTLSFLTASEESRRERLMGTSMTPSRKDTPGLDEHVWPFMRGPGQRKGV